MPFLRKDFAKASAHANSSIPTNWNYTTPDTPATVNTAGYFNDVSGQVKVGDQIYAVCTNGGTIAPTNFYVNSNSAGVVDVTDGVALVTTDTD